MDCHLEHSSVWSPIVELEEKDMRRLESCERWPSLEKGLKTFPSLTKSVTKMYRGASLRRGPTFL